MAANIRRFRRLWGELLAAAVSGRRGAGPSETPSSVARFNLRPYAPVFDDSVVEGLFLAAELSAWQSTRMFALLFIGFPVALLSEAAVLADANLRSSGLDAAVVTCGVAAVCFFGAVAETFRLARSTRASSTSRLNLGAETQPGTPAFGVHAKNLAELREQFSADRGGHDQIIFRHRRLSGLICAAAALHVIAATIFAVAGCELSAPELYPSGSACVAILDGYPPLALFAAHPIIPLWLAAIQRPRFAHTIVLLFVIAISGVVTLPPAFAAGVCVVAVIAGRGAHVISVTPRRQFALFFFAVNILVSQQQATRRAFRVQASRDAAQTIVGFASHELRNPLHAIARICEGLLDVPTQPAMVRADLATMRESIQRMTEIIDDALLDLGKIQRGRLHIRPRNVALRETLLELAKHFNERLALGVAVEFSDEFPDACYVDGGRLRRIVANGLEHLIDSLPDGRGACVIAARSQARGPRTWLTIDVVAKGVGLGGVDPETLFRPFDHGDSASWSSGLGLPIAHGLTALLHGRVEMFESPSVDGDPLTTFRLQVPVDPPRDVEERRTGAELSPLPSLRVLVVDDERTNRLIACRMLKKLGCSVETASDGDEVRSASLLGDAPEIPDLVLMDIMMRRENGDDCAARLIRDGVRRPIVACTANTTEGDIARYLDIGMVGALTKPFDLRQLHGVLLRACAPRSLG